MLCARWHRRGAIHAVILTEDHRLTLLQQRHHRLGAQRSPDELARLALIRLRSHRKDPRNWRPNILLFVGDPEKRHGLVRLANWFGQDRGLVTACRLIVGDLATRALEREPTAVPLPLSQGAHRETGGR